MHDCDLYIRVVSIPRPHVQGFFLKMITRQGDGLTDVVTSVPCETGTVQEICLVEVTSSSLGLVLH